MTKYIFIAIAVIIVIIIIGKVVPGLEAISKVLLFPIYVTYPNSQFHNF